MPEFHPYDRPLLTVLAEWHERQNRLGRTWGWARPMDIGARGASGHSQSLARLVKLGLVERRQRPDVPPPPSGMRSRPSFEYRLSDAGFQILTTQPGDCDATATE